MNSIYDWLAFTAWVLVGLLFGGILLCELAFVVVLKDFTMPDLILMVSDIITIFIWSTLIEIRWGAR